MVLMRLRFRLRGEHNAAQHRNTHLLRKITVGAPTSNVELDLVAFAMQKLIMIQHRGLSLM